MHRRELECQYRLQRFRWSVGGIWEVDDHGWPWRRGSGEYAWRKTRCRNRMSVASIEKYAWRKTRCRNRMRVASIEKVHRAEEVALARRFHFVKCWTPEVLGAVSGAGILAAAGGCSSPAPVSRSKSPDLKPDPISGRQNATASRSVPAANSGNGALRKTGEQI